MRADILIHLQTDGPLSLQEQVRRGIMRAVAAGDLAPGARAPSSRRLAARLGVSRNTVLLAYQQLASEGFLLGRERSGLFVAADLAPAPPPGRGEVAGGRAEPATASWRPNFRTSTRVDEPRRVPPDWTRYPYPFIDGLIEPSLFPIADWREASRRALNGRDVTAWASGQGDADDPTLIDEVRTKLLPRRGIHAGADEILITLGREQAVSLALSMFAGRRTPVVLEEPGHSDTRELARSLGAVVTPQRVDGFGLVIDATLDAAEVIVVTPSHQHPTGVTLSLERRLGLLRSARRSGAVIIEDDVDCETRYFDAALPALRALPGGDRVIYAAGLSAVLGPSVRLGFMVAEPAVILEARRLRRLSIGHPPLANQHTAAYFLSQGFYDKAMARAGRVLTRRRWALGEALNHYLQRWVTIDPAARGTSLWVRGPEGLDVRGVVRDAQSRGLLIEPVDAHYATVAPPHLFRLGVTGISEGRIRAGVQMLAGLIRERISPSYDVAALPPAWPREDALHTAMAGATLLCKTVEGAPCVIELAPDGTMQGRAGWANDDHDEGRWWVEGEVWFRQWRSWAYGEAAGFRALIRDGGVKWLNADGRVVDEAAYVAPGEPAAAVGCPPD